jgi:lipoprotein-releasing system permease protein
MIALNLSDGVQILQNALDVSLLSADVYFVDALPAQLLWSDVWLTALIAVMLALLATYYPAKKAASIVAAEHLH